MVSSDVVARVMQFAPLIRRWATARSLPASVVAGLIAVESGGNPRAKSPDNGHGLGSAMGLTQCLGEDFGVGEDPFDPETSIRVGTGVLRGKMDRFGGRLDSGLAAYFGAVDGSGNPTGGTDVTGTTGVRYVELIHGASGSFRSLDVVAPADPAPAVSGAIEVDEVFREYAPGTGTWREAAINLKGICDDALAAGRKVVAEASLTWGKR